MTTTPRQSALRLIISLLLSTLLFSCGGGNPAQDDNGAGIAFRLKWPLAKATGNVPPGVTTVRMSVSAPDMPTIIRDFAVSDHTGSITNVPVGSNRTISFQGLASNSDLIYQAVIPNATLKSGIPYQCGTVTMTAVVSPSTPTVPAAPTGLSATAVSTSQINLAWVDNANNETGYMIERKTGSGTYSPIATVAANDIIYSDTSLSASTTYYYRIRATSSAGDSDYGNEATATTTVPTPASTYSLTGRITSGGAALAGATVTRTGNGTTTTTTDSSGNYSFSGAQNGGYTLTPAKSGYTFIPAMLQVTLDGANLSALNFAATAVSTPPSIPAGLSATAASASQINLAWTDTNNETGYEIQRKTGSGGSYTGIATVAANVTTYNDTPLSAATTYCYRIQATNSVGTSGYGNEADATTPANSYSISGTITSGGSTLAGVAVTLTGSGSTAVTTNSSGIYSFSGALDGSYTLTPALAGYTFNPATLPVTVNGSNLTAMNFVATLIPVIPAAPSNLIAKAVSSNLINLAWKDNAANETAYKIERRDASSGDYAQIATVAANVTTYRDIVPSASTTYYYRVRANNGTIDSEYSAEASDTTLVAGALISPAMVTVGSFSIGKYEVTQGEWLAIMGNNPSLFPGCGPNCPVENVNWNDVQNFIATLNARSGMNYRLPTKAEWQTTAQTGGFTYSGSNDVNAVAWYSGNSGSTTHTVGQKQPNGLGIYDMSGNVWEWVNDYHQNYGVVDYTTRVLLGGGWGVVPYVPTDVSTTANSFANPTYKGNMVGFRLASSP